MHTFADPATSPMRRKAPPPVTGTERPTRTTRREAKPTGSPAVPGLRATRQRALIADQLARSQGFHGAQDLHIELRRQGHRIGLSTVYRHLQRLADAGVVDVVHTADGETVYRHCGTHAHHHHLVCRHCGQTQEVEGPEIEAWAGRVAAKAGFVDVEHTIEIFGTCGSCAANDEQEPSITPQSGFR
jgi:Fur family ferric uptake transcriptional regulator